MNRIEQLLHFIEESPQDPFLHYALTMEYLKTGDDIKAREGFENLLASYPNYVGTYYHFAKFLEKNNESLKAEAVYNQGIVVARAARNMHALSELQGALNLLKGLADEDE